MAEGHLISELNMILFCLVTNIKYTYNLELTHSKSPKEHNNNYNLEVVVDRFYFCFH